MSDDEKLPELPEGLKEFFKDCPKRPEDAEIAYVHGDFWGPYTNEDGTIRNAGGLELSWGIKSRGFGVYTFVKMPDGSYEIDTEHDGIEWVRLVLNAFLDQCKVRG